MNLAAAGAEQNLLYRHYKPNEPTKKEPLSFVLLESPFTSVSIVSMGHPSLISLVTSRYLLSIPIIKGIVQPFELGGETSLIRSAVKYWKAGMFKKKNNDTISREEHKTLFSGLRISEMTLSNQSHFPQFLVPGR
jgi:hypothetical protein